MESAPKTDGGALTPRMLATFRRALDAERQRLLGDVGWSATTARALGQAQAEEGASTGSPGDVASDLAGQELAVTLERAERRQLARVEDALQRLATGGYGLCEACGHPIELARLRALPWAAVCRDCVRSAGGLRAERGGGGASNGGGAKARRSGAVAPPSLA